MSGAYDGAPRARDTSEDSGSSIDERYPVQRPDETPGDLDEESEAEAEQATQEMSAADALAGSSEETEPAPEPDERIDDAKTRVNGMAYSPGDYADGNDYAQKMQPSTRAGTEPVPDAGASSDDRDGSGVSSVTDLNWSEFIQRFGFWQQRRYASRTQLVGAFECSPQTSGVSGEGMLTQAIEAGYIAEQKPVAGGYRYHPGAEVQDHV